MPKDEATTTSPKELVELVKELQRRIAVQESRLKLLEVRLNTHHQPQPVGFVRSVRV